MSNTGNSGNNKGEDVGKYLLRRFHRINVFMLLDKFKPLKIKINLNETHRAVKYQFTFTLYLLEVCTLRYY